MKKQVIRFLEQESTLTLATTSPEGTPNAADLYFVSNDALELFFISEPDANHAVNISQNDQIAATIHSTTWDWREIKGLQLRGSCSQVTGTRKRMAALHVYGKKFKFMPAFSAIVARHNVYRIIPSWLRWLDNSVSFGYKQESELGSGE
ncbi:MAG: pyridoxamine 5'-phosphate oxidase family protein [Anaerolineales bacterium]|nr:pyridoxamine 5'-phosphate oxidase family protein [Anaerolineales bacterium]